MLSCLILGLLLISCDGKSYKPPVKKEKGDTKNTYIITLTVNGESHEFVEYFQRESSSSSVGMSHWPGCKYCKNTVNYEY